MNTNIYIPKRINVGYQDRKGTYTGKLAYVIYYDEKGKLRKETSWNNWRDKNIPNTEFDNEPTEGFVLNKKVGDYHYSYWEHRQAYCRVYDPRGFEFEITIENLLYILENTSSVVGKGLEGEFVYGWSGKDLILIPTSSADYKEIMEFSKLLEEREPIRAKDLIIGATYKRKNGDELIYMGRYEKYGCGYHYIDPNTGEKKITLKYADIPYEKRGSMRWNYVVDYQCKYDMPLGKYYWFIKDGSKWFSHYKTISKDMFISCINEECHKDYEKYYDMMEDDYEFSKIDYDGAVLENATFEEIERKAMIQGINGLYYYSFEFLSDYDGEIKKYKACACHEEYEKYYYKVQTYKKVEEYFIEKFQWVTLPNKSNLSLEQLYETFKPKYYVIKLSNGRLYKKDVDK